MTTSKGRITLSESSVVAKNGDLNSVTLKDKCYVLSPDSNKLIELNETGQLIWNIVHARKSTVGKLIDAVCKEYGMEDNRKAVADDVVEFLLVLVQNGVVTVSASA
jgi:hypothetical protein